MTSSKKSSSDPFEDLWLWGLGLFVLASLPFGAMFDEVRAFLVGNGILVPAEAALVEIPGTGTGLDLARLAIVAGFLFLFVVGAVAAARRRRAAQEES